LRTLGKAFTEVLTLLLIPLSAGLHGLEIFEDTFILQEYIDSDPRAVVYRYVAFFVETCGQQDHKKHRLGLFLRSVPKYADLSKCTD